MMEQVCVGWFHFPLHKNLNGRYEQKIGESAVTKPLIKNLYSFYTEIVLAVPK